jgi:hypothetical protein
MAAWLIALALFAPGLSAHDPTVLHDRIAGQWAHAMRSDGTFVDPYTHAPATGYGTVMLAVAMVEAAGRDHDPWLRRQALRAGWAVTRRDPRIGGVFEEWAVARLYNLLRHEPLPGSGALRDAVARHLQRIADPYVDPSGGACYRDSRCFSNHEVVEAAADHELLATGLGSPRAGAKLHDRALLESRVRRFADFVPRVLVDGRTEAGPRGALLADTNAWPVAYHALSTMFLGELVDASSSPQARAALARAKDGICQMSGPDGDMSYNGARQGQAWVTAMALAALGDDPACPDVAAALWRRLEGYGFGRVGLNPTARFRDGADDYYALDGDAVTTNALVLMALSRLGKPSADHAPPAAHPSWYSLGRAGWAIARTDRVWMAVRSHARYPQSPVARMDLRYDAGIVALKQRVGGTWRDLLRPRPRSVDGGVPAGPMLLGPEPLLPAGRLSYRAGAVVLNGRFMGRSGARGRRVRIVYRLQADGVRASMRVRAGERIRLGFFLSHAGYRASAGRIATPSTSVTVSPARPFAATPGFASCCDRHLDDVHTTVAFARPGRLVWTIQAGTGRSS